MKRQVPPLWILMYIDLCLVSGEPIETHYLTGYYDLSPYGTSWYYENRYLDIVKSWW